jgi:hypothetical protein
MSLSDVQEVHRDKLEAATVNYCGRHEVTRAQPLVTTFLSAVSSAVEAVMLLKDRRVVQRRHQEPAISTLDAPVDDRCGATLQGTNGSDRPG